MGRKVKEFKSKDDVNAILLSILIPENILQDFDPVDATKRKDDWLIDMVEKLDRIPKELQGSEIKVVQDGFCNPLEILSHSFSAGPVRLRIKRRRWKVSGSDTHYSNDYDLTLKGMKMVPELGIFLKEED